MSIRISVVLGASALALGGCSKSESGLTLGAPASLGAVTVKAPTTWSAEPPSSAMRRAQWKIPGAADGDGAELVVFYFGAGGGGSIQANLERWHGQFEQPDGRPSSEVAETLTATIAGMKVTKTEVGGRFVAAVRPGAEKRHDQGGWRMLAAIVEAPGGALYFKMVGPDATVKAAKPGFEALLGSLTKTE